MAKKWLVIEGSSRDRAHASDLVNAVLGSGGSLAWSILPAPTSDGSVETASVPGPEDPSSVIVRIHLGDGIELDDAALTALRARADAYAQDHRLAITAMVVRTRD